MLTNYDEEPLGFLLQDVTRLLRGRIDAALEGAGLGLTPGEARTLVHLGRFAPLQQRALAARMCIEPMTLVRYLDRLEAAGLLRREIDPDDKRAKRVHLTPEAAPLLAQVLALAAAIRSEAAQGITRADLASLRSSLLTMRANMAPDESRAA